jgi:AcrR family transcriptional regulator
MRRGTAGARMQEIAEEAGVNKALLHYYFRNKARLGEAIFRRVASAPLDGSAILGGPATLDEKVRQVVALYLDQLGHAVRARVRHQRDQPAPGARQTAARGHRPTGGASDRRTLHRHARAPTEGRRARGANPPDLDRPVPCQPRVALRSSRSSR